VTTKDTGDVTDVDKTETVTVEFLDEVDDAIENEDSDTDEKPDGIVRRSARVVVGRLGAIVLAVALLASAGVAAWMYFERYRPDLQTNDASATVALDAAKTGTIALLSYSPESLDKDFANAKSHLTGDFLSYYTQFTEQIVTPAAKQKSVKTAASVVRAGVSELNPDSAVVLVFINQTTTSKENPDGAFAASAVKVGLKKINDAWLISAFDPV
jgi:Mce-associated membrane protein